ncbi:cellulose binding domain-containing protein [Mycobacterium sp.]|uniref:cellulose binding domain-containing protein n=1 Tax=Mycobacterium sp. TaxID=1785 RepID=UPI003A876624
MTGLGRYVKLWCTVHHATVSAFVIALTGLGLAPAAHAAAPAATLWVSSAWQTGFIAHFTISNMSLTELNGWRLEFDLSPGESIQHTF